MNLAEIRIWSNLVERDTPLHQMRRPWRRRIGWRRNPQDNSQLSIFTDNLTGNKEDDGHWLQSSLSPVLLPRSLVDAFADPVTCSRDPMVDSRLASLCARVTRAHLEQHQRLDNQPFFNWSQVTRPISVHRPSCSIINGPPESPWQES